MVRSIHYRGSEAARGLAAIQVRAVPGMEDTVRLFFSDSNGDVCFTCSASYPDAEHFGPTGWAARTGKPGEGMTEEEARLWTADPYTESVWGGSDW